MSTRAAVSANQLYDFSALPRRRPLRLPNDARVAFWAGVAVEHYAVDRPGMSIAPHSASFVPDPMNFGWRDYGLRVGIWRLADMFARFGVPVSALLNSDACRLYPEVIDEGRQRGWAWVAHGHNNNTIHQGLAVDDERELLREMTDTIRGSTGQQPRGWIGPVLTETYETPRLLRELGYTYVLDWCSDDQPFPLNVTPGPMISVPYSIELNDATLFVGRNMSGVDFERALIDQFDVLYEEASESARVMAVGLHPWIVGQPFRFKYLERAIEHIARRDGVWLATSDQIADWYLGQLRE